MGGLIMKEEIMSLQGTLADQILDAVRRAPDSLLQDLDFSSPELTWNQILLEIDRLNQTGQLETISKGNGVYTVRLPQSPKAAKRGFGEGFMPSAPDQNNEMGERGTWTTPTEIS
jgi:hypothetical protein